MLVDGDLDVGLPENVFRHLGKRRLEDDGPPLEVLIGDHLVFIIRLPEGLGGHVVSNGLCEELGLFFILGEEVYGLFLSRDSG